MSYTNILYHVENSICTITINRPDKLNALNKETIAEVGVAFASAQKDDQVRGIILTGAGSKAFIAGADISEFSSFNLEQGMALSKHGHDVFDSVENCSKPVIAAVNGFALGGGCELAMEILNKILAQAPVAVAEIVRSVNAYYSKTENGYEVEIARFGACFTTEDFKEGTDAFMNKRKAAFTGK